MPTENKPAEPLKVERSTVTKLVITGPINTYMHLQARSEAINAVRSQSATQYSSNGVTQVSN